MTRKASLYPSLSPWNGYGAFYPHPYAPPPPPPILKKKMCVSLEFPWTRTKTNPTPLQLKVVVHDRDTVETFLYDFLRTRTPPCVWRQFQARYSERFAIRTGPSSCFQLEGFHPDTDPVFDLSLVSSHDPDQSPLSPYDPILDCGKNSNSNNKIILILQVEESNDRTGWNDATPVLRIVDGRNAPQKKRTASDGRKNSAPKKRPRKASDENTVSKVLFSAQSEDEEENSNDDYLAEHAGNHDDDDYEDEEKGDANLADFVAHDNDDDDSAEEELPTTAIDSEWSDDEPVCNDDSDAMPGEIDDNNEASVSVDNEEQSVDEDAPTDKITAEMMDEYLPEEGDYHVEDKMTKDEAWQLRFQELVEFKNKFGHCK